MSQSGPPVPKPDKHLTVHEMQNWAQENVGRIWFVVVVVLAVVSAIFFFPHLSLVLLGLGLLGGALAPIPVGSALHKGRRLIAQQSDGARLAILVAVGVVSIILPFLFTAWVGALGGVALVVDQKIMDLISGRIGE
ncbi:MAG: hypothetical protein ACOYKZ_02765 [Chlamydiia bacterium]